MRTLDADYAFIRDADRRRAAPRPLQRVNPAADATTPMLPRARPLPARERLVFWDFPSSPFCVKVRSILHFKGLTFEAVDALKPRRWRELRRRGIGKVPALEIDGRFVTDSTDIAHELDRLYPQHPVLPADRRHRAACHMLEEWADEGLYFIGLYYLWLHPEARGGMAEHFGRDWLGRLAYRLYLRRIRAQVRGQGTGRKSAEAVERDLVRHLDAAEAMLEGRRFLLGDEPLLADFALFGQLTLLLAAPASAVRLQQRASLMRYVDRMRLLSAPRSDAPAAAVRRAA